MINELTKIMQKYFFVNNPVFKLARDDFSEFYITHKYQEYTIFIRTFSKYWNTKVDYFSGLGTDIVPGNYCFDSRVGAPGTGIYYQFTVQKTKDLKIDSKKFIDTCIMFESKVSELETKISHRNKEIKSLRKALKNK